MVEYYYNIEQGTDEWLELRRGILTASEMGLLITPATKKIANNDKSRAHIYELAAQRISKYVEPYYISDDMLRGHEEEIYARELYSDKYTPVTECGFITNNEHGFTIGYSPDGLVGGYGLIEIKSRRQKFQIETIIANEVPTEHIIQIQTGLLVSKRLWLDFISYCGGLPMFVKRVYPDPVLHAALIEVGQKTEADIQEKIAKFEGNVSELKLYPTERQIEQEIII